MARKRGRALIARSRHRYSPAMECLERALAARIVYLRFPAVHHRRIRTTNQFRRLNGEGPRRTKVIPLFPPERSCLTLLFATLMTASKHCRGVPMSTATLRQLQTVRPEITADAASNEAAARTEVGDAKRLGLLHDDRDLTYSLLQSHCRAC